MPLLYQYGQNCKYRLVFILILKWSLYLRTYRYFRERKCKNRLVFILKSQQLLYFCPKWNCFSMFLLLHDTMSGCPYSVSYEKQRLPRRVVACQLSSRVRLASLAVQLLLGEAGGRGGGCNFVLVLYPPETVSDCPRTLFCFYMLKI